MKEKFNMGFWDPDYMDFAQKVLKINKSFPWEGEFWQIPGIYLFEEGFVMDLCTRIPIKDIQAFFTNWPMEKRVGSISPKELEAMSIQSPGKQDFFIEDVRIDGEKTCQSCSRSFVWHPLDQEQDQLSQEGQEAVDKYALSREWGWRITRSFFPWPHESKSGISSLQFVLKEPRAGYPCQQEFITTVGMKDQKISVTHPVSGEIYELCIKTCEGKSCAELIMQEQDVEYPSYCQAVTYEMTSETASDVSQNDYYIRDTCKGDSPRSQGGAMALCVTAESQEAYSSLYFQIPEKIQWYIAFLVQAKKPLPIQITL